LSEAVASRWGKAEIWAARCWLWAYPDQVTLALKLDTFPPAKQLAASPSLAERNQVCLDSGSSATAICLWELPEGGSWGLVDPHLTWNLCASGKMARLMLPES
jgi:hypothetical protein